MVFRSCALTHPGMRRDENEDHFCARPDLGLFVVADGLGGHPGGRLASRIVAEAIEATIAGTLDPADVARFNVSSAAEPEQRMRDAFHVAYERLTLVAGEAAELFGMATTAAAVMLSDLVAPDGHPAIRAIVAHVGDSRVYRLHSRALERLTLDHSWVEDQVRAGLLEKEAAQKHPWRSLITRAISSAEEEDQPDIRRATLQPGDRLLLCSDGLSSVLNDDQIAAALAQPIAAGAEESICQSLVHMANLAGGPDNITVIVVSL
jgi:protein phosphatase